MLRKLTVQRVAFISLFVLVFAMATRVPTDTDTWWHIRAGEHTVQHRAVLTYDPFSHTRGGAPWINHSWLAQVVLYLFYRAGGSAGLALFTALAATAGMGFVYAACEGNVYVRAFALVLGASTAAVFWSARPQMLSFFFSTIVFYLLHLHKRGGRDLLLLIPLLMLLWANVHGGFAIGFILILGSIAGETVGNLLRRGDPEGVDWAGVRKLGLVVALSLAAICINPYGTVMLTYPFRTVGIGALQDYIQEWASPDFHLRQTWPFAFLLLAVLAAVGRSGRRIDWTDLTLVSGTAFMALLAGRNMATFAVAATPVLTRHVDAWLQARGWRLRPARRARGAQAYINLLLVMLIVLGAGLNVAGVLLPQTIRETQEAHLPMRAAAWLRDSDVSGNMFNSYNWGGYLMFAVPAHPVFVDGRTDLYDNAFLRTFHDAWQGLPGWEDVMDRYDIGFAVIEAGSLLAGKMREDADWTLRYEDGQAAIFARVPGGVGEAGERAPRGEGKVKS